MIGHLRFRVADDEEVAADDVVRDSNRDGVLSDEAEAGTAAAAAKTDDRPLAAACVSFQRMTADPVVAICRCSVSPAMISAKSPSAVTSSSLHAHTPATKARPIFPLAIGSAVMTNFPRWSVSEDPDDSPSDGSTHRNATRIAN
jgi:hypothetical protein